MRIGSLEYLQITEKTRAWDAAGDYLAPLEQMDYAYATGGSAFRNMLAWQWVYVGRYADALKLYAYKEIRPPSPAHVQALVAAVKPEPIESLCRIAKGQKLLIINESPQAPWHRALGRRLLPCLKDAGYSHVAFEDLGQSGESLRTQGHVTLTSGYHVVEPQLAGLINDSLALGFTPVSYEVAWVNEALPGDKERDRSILREQGQFDNLKARLFSKAPQAKALLWVQLAHAQEKALDTPQRKRTLATLIRENTGVDPYTVAQDVDMEPTYFSALVNAAFPSDQPLLIDLRKAWAVLPPEARAELYEDGHDNPGVDAVIVHPRHAPEQPRAAWLNLKRETAVRLRCPACEVKPTLVQLFRPDDDPALVPPVDQVLCESPAKCLGLVAPDGRYRVRIRNEDEVLFDAPREVRGTLEVDLGR